LRKRIAIGLSLLVVVALVGMWTFAPQAIPFLRRTWEASGEPGILARAGYLLAFCALVFILSLKVVKPGPM